MIGEIAAAVLFALLFRALFALDKAGYNARMERRISAAMRQPGPVRILPKGAADFHIENYNVVEQDVK